jgi:hypothetical protein
LQKMVVTPSETRQFSVAFNIRSKFEDAYQKKVEATAKAPKKMYPTQIIFIHSNIVKSL